MDKKPEALDLAKIEADEFARLEAESPGRPALEHEAQSDRNAQARREALEKAWQEQEEYSRAMSELKPAARASRGAPTILAALLLAAAIVGAVAYSYRAERDRLAEAEALRIAAQSLERQEAEERARQSGAPAWSWAGRCRAAEPVPTPRSDEGLPGGAEKARAFALKIREEARRQAQLRGAGQGDGSRRR
jgi:hypothetical protein